MSAGTSIEWTHYTFNPWWGCQRVSPGCEHCYAETFAHRLGLKVWGPDSPRRFFGDRHWAVPMDWWRRRVKGDPRHLVFCASMADVFEDRRDLDASRARLFELIETTAPSLTWQLLTKRPENVARLAPRRWLSGAWPSSAWLGTTAEDQARADQRVPLLLQTPAAVRFVSYEPGLAAVNFTNIKAEPGEFGWLDALTSGPAWNLPALDWVIVGGESGPGARPFDLAWARSAVAQCKAAGVPVFVKQLGAWPFDGYLSEREVLDGAKGRARPKDQPLTDEQALAIMESEGASVLVPHFLKLRDRKGGSMEEWPEDLRVREFPKVPA